MTTTTTMRRVATLAAMAAAAMALTGPSTAQADTCRTVSTPIRDFTVCGAALSKTNKTMYAATLDGGKQCTVYDTGGHKISTTMKCASHTVKPGKTAGIRDTDAIMFKSGYAINGHDIPGGKWVKVKVAVVCVNPFNTKVRCFGI